MTASTLGVKSNMVTHLDATPPTRDTYGQNGGAGRLVMLEASVTPGASTASPVYYPMVRVPSNALIKRVWVAIDAPSTTTFTSDITLFWSDNALDGTDANAGVGLVVTGGSGGTTALSGAASFFAHAEAIGGYTAGIFTDVTFKNAGNASGYVPSLLNKPLWQAANTQILNAAGIAVDPGGFFDISFLTTASNVNAATPVTMRVELIQP